MMRSSLAARRVVGVTCGVAIAVGIACGGGEARTAETGAADAKAAPASVDAPAEAAATKSAAAGGKGDPALAKIDEFISAQKIDKSASGWKTHLPKPPQLEFDKGTTYYWDLQTNVGPISMKLMPDVAPMHVSSTIYLTRLGFYDGLTFHRVIPGFMAQGGCPLGNGRGGPGYRFAGEFDRSVRHDRPGLLSMANAGPGTDGSQFFITFVPTPHLDGKHTIYGEVVSGMETVRELETRRQRGNPHMNEPLVIESATIRVE